MWCRLYSSLLPGYSAKPSRWPNSHGLPAELCGEPGGFWPQHKHWRQNQTRPHPAAVAPVCRVRCPGHCGGSHSPNHSNSDAVVPIPYLTPFSHTPSTSSICDVHSRTSLCLQAPGLLKGSFLLKTKLKCSMLMVQSHMLQWHWWTSHDLKPYLWAGIFFFCSELRVKIIGVVSHLDSKCSFQLLRSSLEFYFIVTALLLQYTFIIAVNYDLAVLIIRFTTALKLPR